MKSESSTLTPRDVKRFHDDQVLAAGLESVGVVSSEPVPKDIVTMNSRVLFEDKSSGARNEVTIVHPDDADTACGDISVLAPAASAMRGLSVGQCIDCLFPHGTTRRLRVLNVVHQAKARQRLRAEYGFLSVGVLVSKCMTGRKIMFQKLGTERSLFMDCDLPAMAK